MTMLLGIDPGFAAMGIALAEAKGPKLEWIDVFVIRTKPSGGKGKWAQDTHDRMNELAHELLKLFRDEDFTVVGVEAGAFPVGQVRYTVIANLGRVRGLFDAFEAVFGFNVVESTTAEVKAAAFGHLWSTEKRVSSRGKKFLKKVDLSRGASKKQVKASLEKRWPELKKMWPKQKGLHEHAADACAALVAAWQKMLKGSA